jgi:p-cumate 2,3-dioxygenase subunit beta
MIGTGHTAAEALPAGEPDRGTLAASLHLGSVTRVQIEDFLYREARLLDDWDLDTWLTLWAEEGTRYVVPCNDDPDGDPARDLVLIDDDQLRIRSKRSVLDMTELRPAGDLAIVL